MRVDAGKQLHRPAELVTLIANQMDAVLSECVATFIYDRRDVLVADAAQNVIWQVNTGTGDCTMTFDGPTIKPTHEVTLGVNKLHIHISACILYQPRHRFRRQGGHLAE